LKEIEAECALLVHGGRGCGNGSMSEFHDFDQRLARIEEAIAGVAKNVDVTALGAHLRAIRDDLTLLRSELRVLRATVERIVCYR
jgi:hypothetical protein